MTTPASTPTRTLWPYAIIMAFLLFGSYISYMVSQTMQTNVDLVSPNYYQQELAYQQRIDSEARTATLPGAVSIHYQAAAQQLRLQLPATLRGQKLEGEIHFFRPSNLKLDFTLPLQPDAELAQHLSTTKMQPGHWRIRLNFKAGKQTYFVEQSLTL